MKGTVFFLFCVIALSYAELEGVFNNGCPKDTSVSKLLPHEQCDQYYECLHGILIPRFCPSGLHFNLQLESCDWNGVTKCYKKREYKKGKRYSKLPENPDELDNSNPRDVYSICSASDSNGILVAHQNCNDFYKCSYGKPVALKCAQGLLYNPINQKCDWPQNVDCGERVILGGFNENSTQFKRKNRVFKSSNDDIENANLETSQATNICLATGSDGVLVAHENCNQFYKCFNSVPVSMKCPGHLLYHPTKEYCDWPRNVDCEGRSIPDDDGDDDDNDMGPGSDLKNIESEENEVGSGDDSTDSPAKLSHDDPDQAPTICAAPHSTGILVAHKNCNQFYKCVNGRPIALQCPKGLVYSQDKFYCDWPYNTDCRDRIMPDNIDETDSDHKSTTTEAEPSIETNNDPRLASEICKSEGSEGMLFAHENCNEFYKCYQKRSVALKCQGILLYDPIKEYCDWPSHVDCGERKALEKSIAESYNKLVNRDTFNVKTNVDPSKAPEVCAADNSNGALIAHENCNQFYKCFENKPVALFCQLNLLYNPVKEYCDWPQNVVCDKRLLPGAKKQNYTEDDTSGAAKECAGQPDGIVIPHANCNQFYKCLSGQSFPLECPPGLYFNIGLKVCDWPMNVNCGDRLTDSHGVARRALKIVVPMPSTH